MQTVREYNNSGNADKYEWKSASVNVAGTDATTDITGSAGFTTLFGTLVEAGHIVIEASATTYVRLNTSSSDKITITSTTPFEADMAVRKIFISTNGSASTVTVKLTA